MLHSRAMRPCILAAVVSLLTAPALFAQTVLTADGQTDTYTLINSVLGGTAEETPDCSHTAFGPHITQTSDANLRKAVFVFHMHVTPDNDRCVNFDRQRNEIKTYGPSPAYLKAFLGESTTYRWKFKLDAGFQPSPSFTHIHQIKAGDGDDAAPIITITPRTGSPDILQLIHVDSAGLSTVLTSTPLAPFKGAWVEAYEKLTFDHNGTYSLEIRRLSDGALLFSYSDDNIDLWRTGTTFCRPKWGIYRSLNNQSFLRDEQVRFDRFCLAKGADDCPTDRDFAFAATPASRTVVAGTSTTYTVSVTPLGGFGGSVSLSAGGLPGGATASFSPASIAGSGSAILTVSTTPATPTGARTLTIAGTSGSVSHSTTVTLQVNPAPCVTASATWQHFAFASQTGSFTAEFDATPASSPINNVIGLSRGPQTAYTGLAAIARFNPSGNIDARNGGAYAAASTIPYASGVKYHFRLAINVPARTYSIFVTPAGGTEKLVGTNFAFRTEQSTVTSLDSWATFAQAGSSTVCAFFIH